jgi:hypothetical protein
MNHTLEGSTLASISSDAKKMEVVRELPAALANFARTYPYYVADI